MTEARRIGEIITPEYIAQFDPDKQRTSRWNTARRFVRLLAHMAAPILIAPPMSLEGQRYRRGQRYDRLLGWVETCPFCHAPTCQCGGFAHD